MHASQNPCGSELARDSGVSGPQYAAVFKFAFVRDPLERAYSAYAFLRGNTLGVRDQAARKMVGQYRDFDDFVARWLHPENITRQLHFAAQTDFLIDSFGHLAMDFIGCQAYLDRGARLPHVNHSWQRATVPVGDICSVRTRRLVRRVYQRDYEMLGYE
ncbi:Sulfotransferase family protein [Pseudomonas sp. NFACC15-1]|nr:Sulfotransferase family protein [Pseudomonas sp. NFACC15-1]SDZ26788.1 Sulfotransferase family protein [Pseudomonas sp. NFACC14]